MEVSALGCLRDGTDTSLHQLRRECKAAPGSLEIARSSRYFSLQPNWSLTQDIPSPARDAKRLLREQAEPDLDASLLTRRESRIQKPVCGATSEPHVRWMENSNLVLVTILPSSAGVAMLRNEPHTLPLAQTFLFHGNTTHLLFPNLESQSAQKPRQKSPIK